MLSELNHEGAPLDFEEYSKLYLDQKGESPCKFSVKFSELGFETISKPVESLIEAVAFYEEAKEFAIKIEIILWDGQVLENGKYSNNHFIDCDAIAIQYYLIGLLARAFFCKNSKEINTSKIEKKNSGVSGGG